MTDNLEPIYADASPALQKAVDSLRRKSLQGDFSELFHQFCLHGAKKVLGPVTPQGRYTLDEQKDGTMVVICPPLEVPVQTEKPDPFEPIALEVIHHGPLGSTLRSGR